MSNLAVYIQSCFGSVQRDEMDIIISLFKPATIKKGDYYLKTGHPCHTLSFIQTGLMRIFSVTENKEVTQWISTQGQFVTDLSSLFFGKPARWTIQALTDTTLYTIHKEDYNNIGKLIPHWHELEKYFIANCFIILEDRVFNHLSLSAEERYDAFFHQNKELFNQVPMQYIASMLGMTPETFSRIRRKKIS